MKRKKAKVGSKQTGGPSQLGRDKAVAQTRAKVAVMSRNFLIAAAVLVFFGGLGWWGYTTSQADRDLSVIGNGKPAVVQIHDVTCSSCEALQANTLTALKAFPKDSIEYVVADVRQSEGMRYANSLGENITTLVLMNPQGRRVFTIRGEQSTDQLINYIAQSFEPFGVERK